MLEKFESLFLLPAGIDVVKASSLSGSILVNYDPHKITEESVLQWVGTLWRMISDYYDRLEKIKVNEIDIVINKITPILQNALNENHSFDKQIRLPDNVWS
jgi:allophanate hydrolase subunit 1